jgi:hypothetical protein
MFLARVLRTLLRSAFRVGTGDFTKNLIRLFYLRRIFITDSGFLSRGRGLNWGNFRERRNGRFRGDRVTVDRRRIRIVRWDANPAARVPSVLSLSGGRLISQGAVRRFPERIFLGDRERPGGTKTSGDEQERRRERRSALFREERSRQSPVGRRWDRVRTKGLSGKIWANLGNRGAVSDRRGNRGVYYLERHSS